MKAIARVGFSMTWLAAALLAICSGCTLEITGWEETGRADRPGCPSSVCPAPKPPHDVIPMDLPAELRQSNYSGGSCVHASFVSVLRWQGQYEMADWWKKNHWGAGDVPSLAQQAERANLRYAYTANGNVDFLEWCSRTHRGAVIHYFSNHAVTFCGYSRGDAVLIDNNRPQKEVRIPKAEFLVNWRGYGGYALTLVGTPAPPKPWC